jgi:carbonic anhydrase
MGRVAIIDELLARREAHAPRRPDPLPRQPARRLAAVTCMDARLDVYVMLGLQPGDAHVIRNAGGIVTEDVIRSLVVSQRKLGTRSVLVVQHTDCGLLRITDEEFAAELAADAGHEPEWTAGAFRDLDASVREGVKTLTGNPFLPHADDVRGFVYDVTTGDLREVTD